VNHLVNRSNIAFVFVALMLANGCAERDILSHELSSAGHGGDTSGPANASATGSWDTEADSSIEPRQGNFPEPVVSVCGTLPPGVEPLPGLTSAWALEVEGQFMSGQQTESNGLRLTLSSLGLGCDEAFPANEEPSTCGAYEWWIGMTLQPEVGVGIHDFDETAGIFPEMFGWASDCSGEVVGGYGGYVPSDAPAGRVEIHAITDECVVGTLHYFEFALSGELAELAGGFVAQRCKVDCLPTLENETNDC
jgi:hypothetical protein